MNLLFTAGLLITVTFFGESMPLTHIVSLSAAMQSIPQNTIPYIGTEILIVHCFCIMEMFLFSKSIIAVANSVKISRRIFLDRSQGLKCTKINNSGANQKKYDIPHHLTVSNQDLKHFSKSDILGFAGAVFHGFFPPEGDLTTKLTM